jgi:HAMP domain-containing protein
MNNLQSKIFVFFMALLFVVMIFILLIVYRTTYTHTQTQIAEQLDAGNAVVQNELESRKRYVGSTSRTITKDFNLIEQVVSHDANSISAAIESYRGRAGASFSVVTDTQGKIIASTMVDMEINQILPFGDFSEEEITKAQNVYGLYKDHAYQVFIWPLYAPEPNQIACLVMGYVLDDGLTKRLQKLTGLDVSFIQPGKVFASSLPNTERELLTNADISFTSPNTWRTVTLDNIDYVTFVAPLPMNDGKNIMILLQRSLTDALRDYKSLQLQLIATQIFSLMLAAIGAFFIASTITRPLRRMTEYVKHIAAGKYSAPLPLDSKGEIGILVQEFTHMQHEITEREASILHLAYHDALTNLPNRNDFQRRVQTQVDLAKAGSFRYGSG